MAILIGIFAAYTYTGTTYAPLRGTRPLTMDHVFNGTFYAQHATLRWIPEGQIHTKCAVLPSLTLCSQRETVSTRIRTLGEAS